MSKKLEVTLYYANWCGHCVNFKPEWQKLTDNIEKIQKKYKNIKISLNKFDDEQLKREGGGKINGNDIKGFPTVKFLLKTDRLEKEFDFSDYGKQRNFAYMYEFINNVCNGLNKF